MQAGGPTSFPLARAGGLALAPAAGSPAADGRKAKEAGEAFEAILLKEILRDVVPKSGDASDNWHGMALDAVAKDLAPSIPSGLAKLLEKPE